MAPSFDLRLRSCYVSCSSTAGDLRKDGTKLWTLVCRVFRSNEDAAEEEDDYATGPAARVAVAHAGAVCAATLHWLLLGDAFATAPDFVADAGNGGNSSVGGNSSCKCSGTFVNAMALHVTCNSMTGRYEALSLFGLSGFSCLSKSMSGGAYGAYGAEPIPCLRL